MRDTLEEVQAVVVPIHNQTTRKGKAETLNEILHSDQLLVLALLIARTLADIPMLHQLSSLARRKRAQAVPILPVNLISVIDLREPARMKCILLHQISALARRNPAHAVRILPVNQISVIVLREPARMVGILMHQISALARRNPAQEVHVRILPVNQISVIDLREPATMVGILLDQMTAPLLREAVNVDELLRISSEIHHLCPRAVPQAAKEEIQ